TVKFSELVASSLIGGRTTTFTVNEGVQIIGFEITNYDDMAVKPIDSGAVQYFTDAYNYEVKENTSGSAAVVSYDSKNGDYEIDGNVLKIDNLQGAGGIDKGSFNVTLYLAADANFAGDVEVVASGDALGGVELDPVKVATFAKAFDVTSTVNNVKAGVQATDVADIVIKETENCYFKDGEVVTIAIDTDNTATLVNAIVFKNADVAVTSGDIGIKNIEVVENSGVITFEIDGESTDFSEITISNAEISTAYGLPETTKAPFNVVVNTDSDYNATSDDKNPNTSIKYGSIATPYINITGDNQNALNGATVSVTKDSSTYTVNGEEKTMDVAPFIDATTSSMMVPIRFIAEGVGLTEESGKLVWSATNKTVILRVTDSTIVEFPVGANFYRLNGATIYNDNNAVTQIQDGRTFVPFRSVGTALGLPVSWDGTTMTATYN
ncbi:MAG: stalk domain-containing protein, partial [Coprobacillaceae bacterium]